ncbi:UNVERIFIED_CONTAM: hypothetical protein GTU68_065074, partial [Idotea baltica]|nr:hypothetical protein [Idotea baltica]
LEKLPEFSGLKIKTTIQKEQNGTGDAARVGLEALSEPSNYVAILPGDIPLISSEDLNCLFKLAQPSDVQILTCNHPSPTGFGRIVRNIENKVVSIIEERDASAEQRKIVEINSSIYLIARKVLEENLGKLTSSNAQGELYLTDLVSLAVAAGNSVEAVCVEDYFQLAGANNRVELAELERHRRNQIIEEFQLAGVGFEDPQTCYIDEGVSIAQDSYVGANTRLYGTTKIGTKVVIEVGCYISEAIVSEKSIIGPFVQLRPGTELGSGVRLGNFVEVKNSKFGDFAKANHLAYIGDAEVGAQSNIGAGTIFCNYDGVNKHRSQLGEKVFVGSNSVLVSPVTIGENAYIAAGSTITKNVPSGSLGLGRARQTNIEGWVARKNATINKKD